MQEITAVLSSLLFRPQCLQPRTLHRNRGTSNLEHAQERETRSVGGFKIIIYELPELFNLEKGLPGWWRQFRN